MEIGSDSMKQADFIWTSMLLVHLVFLAETFLSYF